MSGVSESLLELSTKVPYDPRFANHNVMKSCWLSYVQFHNCWANNKDDPDVCSKLATDMNNRCIRPQMMEWDGFRKKGQFPGIAPKYQGKNAPDYEEEEEDEE